MNTIIVPDIGGHENVDIIAVEVKAGDTIAVDDTLITLETDKATMDVTADAAGVVKEVKVKVGDKVSEGDVILILESEEPSETIETTDPWQDEASGTLQEIKAMHPNHYFSALENHLAKRQNRYAKSIKALCDSIRQHRMCAILPAGADISAQNALANCDLLLDTQTLSVWYTNMNKPIYSKDRAQKIVKIYQILSSQEWRIPNDTELKHFTRLARKFNPWRQGDNYRLFGSDYWHCLNRSEHWITDLYYDTIGNYDASSGHIAAVNTKVATYLPAFICYLHEKGMQLVPTDGDRIELLKRLPGLPPSLKQVLADIDYGRCRLPKLEDNWFSDVNKGLWEAHGLDDEQQDKLKLRARDPKIDIRPGNVGIDFGTSSTVVSYTDDNNRAKLLRIGVDDFYAAPRAEHYENPTVLEFIDFQAFLKAWRETAYQPLVRWDDVRCSHEAQLNFRHNDGNPRVVGSVLGKIKQWALRQDRDFRLRITDQAKGFEHEFAPLSLRNPVKGQMLAVSGDDVFDPIELYAWFLGLNINWRSRGIFLNYYMTFPVAYPKDVKEKILASFRRGLLRSLPQPLAENTEVMEGFKVEECATEPAAYVAVAMHAHNIEPTDDGIAYAVFDFGGGTTDFDYGYYRWANEEEENLGLEEIFEHLEAAGDKFLGGENLLENLAYIVFRNNLDICRDKRISFTRPLDAEDFAGSEMLLEKTQAAGTNTLMLMLKLRAYWEKGEISETGTESIDLIDRDGNRTNCTLRLPVDELDRYLDNRIAHGIESFFAAMKKAFNDRMPEHVHILLAGNSSRSRRVTDAFGLSTDETRDALAEERWQRTQESIKRIFTDAPPQMTAYRPLDAEGNDESALTAKTGVALGILRICDADKVKVISHTADANDGGEAPFAHYVGKIRRRKFQAGINRSDAYQEWKEIGVVSEKGIFNLFHTQSNLAYGGNMEEGHTELKIKKIEFPAAEAGKKVFARAVAPDKIEVCTAPDAANIAQDCLQELMLN
ncbi:dihydrolipoamide acetyltransferase component of pyruvate dehydrogenase complex [Neisseria lactamica]|nr:dihydrolipoamide acetyltransferase component of pyruvate dehydrogenase complex [Neisseria lactamica]